MTRNMINLSEETQHGLRQLKADIVSITNKEKVATIYKERNLIDLVKLSLAVGICTVVLYIGLVMVFNANLLADKIPLLAFLLAGCALLLGILSGIKKN